MMTVPFADWHTSGRIVILTQTFDPHADELIVLLRYMGEDPVRVNTDAIPANTLLSCTFARGRAGFPGRESTRPETTPAESGSATLFIDGRQIEACQVKSLWWRRPAPYQFAGLLHADELSLAHMETEQAMRSFWLATQAQGCYQVSTPSAIALSCNLPEQLRRAAGIGFATPRSLLTTRASQLRGFFEETGGPLVYRVLSAQVSSALSGLPTSTSPTSAFLVETAQLATFEEMVAVPCLFHERLPASCLYQVVVIGYQVFAAKSCVAPGDVAHWWSEDIATLPFEPAALDDQVEHACRRLVRSYDLEFAVLRLARGPGEEIFFVSLDPVGPFLWLEQQCPELALRQALAHRLIAGPEEAP